MKLKAVYWSHETRQVEICEQDFEGTYKEIAESYFSIYGDELISLYDGMTMVYTSPWPISYKNLEDALPKTIAVTDPEGLSNLLNDIFK